MLSFINEELFSYGVKIEKNTQTGKDIMQLSVATSNNLMTYAKGSKMDKYHNIQDNQVINKKHDIDMRDNPAIEPINREILTVNYVCEDQLNDPSLLANQPTSLKVTENQRGVPMVSVRCLKSGTENKSDMYVIAFPFNGMILPIAEDPRYRIYKGMIMSSVRPFYFKNRRYRKILYLVVEPHTALFDTNHKYHTDKIDVTLQSFAIYKDRETGEEKTNHETLTINFYKDTETYDWEYEVCDGAKRIEPDSNVPLWVTFKFNQKLKNTSQFGGYKNNYNIGDESAKANHPHKNNGQKSGHIEGNTYVTTNKHGIRKEVPINTNNSKSHRGYANKSNDDFERMMQESLAYEDHTRGHRNKKGKKNKRNSNHRDDYWN